MVHAMNAGRNGLERKETNNVLYNRLFFNNIYDSSSNNIIRRYNATSN